MELIIGYAIFAVVIAIMASVDLFHPVLKECDEISRDVKVIYYVTLFALGLLCAPFLVRSCLSPVTGEIFRKALLDSITKQD